MDAVQTKVQDAITGMINTLDKKCLRRLQVCSSLLMIGSLQPTGHKARVAFRF